MTLEIVPTVPDSSGGIGNTKINPSAKKEKKEKQISPSKNWCFTWNNYPESWFSDLQTNSSKIKSYVYGKEVGESGTPHIQGYIEFKTKLRPKPLFYTTIHWEKTRNIPASIEYCRKDGDYVESGVPAKLKILSDDQLFEWQKSIVKLIESPADDRTINWYYCNKGNTGKSTFCKYLCAKYGALMTSGKASDMKFLVLKYHKSHGDYPKILIMDIPRKSLDYVSYTGIEEIKNGCFASTKFECEMVIMNNPHIICFANRKPEIESMSLDR